MKKRCKFCLSLIMGLMTFLIAMNGMRRKEEALAARIAPEILRFHVLANSDSPGDQALKLEVKELLLEEIRTGNTKASKEAVCRYIEENASLLEQTAENYMSARGFDYEADIRLEQCLFPERTYGDMTFPAGTYDAVRVLLGSGQGKNFWCVLYPSLCCLDSVHAVMPEESRELLKSLLLEDDFDALIKARRPAFYLAGQKNTEQETSLPRVKIRFKLAGLLPSSR